MELTSLINKTLNKAFINDDNDLILLDVGSGDDRRILYLTFSGDCCAKCFVAHVSGVPSRKVTIKQAYTTEWVDKSSWFKKDTDDVVESMGLTLVTTEGTMTIETRVEHNGYYGGNVELSDRGPTDSYGYLSSAYLETTFRELEDF
jgi:hypothetical protein